MTGYTRQSAAEIQTGNVIKASSLNDEFDALASFANATTGHTHDGTVGGGAKIPTAGISGLTSTSSGILAATGSNAVAARTLTGTANEITVTNGTGASGNPTFSLPATLTFTGKTVTGGTFSSPTLIGTPIIDVIRTSGSSGVAIQNSGGTQVVVFGPTNTTNVTFAGAVNINGSEAVTSASNTQTLTNKTINLSSNTLTGTIAQFNTAVSDADLATLAGTETLTNKTINLSSNTLTGTIAQFNTAVSDADLATLAGTETLTNKTINGSNNTLTNVSLTTAVTGTLPIGNGGTGATTAAAARTALGIPFTPASASAPASLEFAEDTDNGTNKVTLSAPASLAADVAVELPSAAGTLALISDIQAQAFNPGGRLTLTTGVPVTTSDVTAASTLYYTPYVSNQIALYSGSAWALYTYTERSLALSGLTASRPYDVFLYDNSGTLTLELTAWTNDTTRATALVYQDGVLVRSGATTRRYLGTIYTTGTTTTEDSAHNRYVWNMYNRVVREMRRTESTASWTYSTAAYRQANNSASNQLNFVLGISEDAVNSSLVANVSNSTSTSRNLFAGLALDVNNNTDWEAGFVTTTTGFFCGAPITRNYYPSAGRHYIAWIEYGAGTDTQTWYGGAKRGLSGSMRA